MSNPDFTPRARLLVVVCTGAWLAYHAFRFYHYPQEWPMAIFVFYADMIELIMGLTLTAIWGLRWSHSGVVGKGLAVALPLLVCTVWLTPVRFQTSVWVKFVAGESRYEARATETLAATSRPKMIDGLYPHVIELEGRRVCFLPWRRWVSYQEGLLYDPEGTFDPSGDTKLQGTPVLRGFHLRGPWYFCGY